MKRCGDDQRKKKEYTEGAECFHKNQEKVPGQLKAEGLLGGSPYTARGREE